MSSSTNVVALLLLVGISMSAEIRTELVSATIDSQRDFSSSRSAPSYHGRHPLVSPANRAYVRTARFEESDLALMLK